MLRRLRRELSAIRLLASALLHLRRSRWYQAMALVGAAEATGAHLAPRFGARLMVRGMAGPHGVSHRQAAETCPAAGRVRVRFRSAASSDLLHANLIVLKSFDSPRERGVLLLKYSEVINAFSLLFDNQAVQARYHLVFEPSTTGFMQPATWLARPDRSVIGVQTVELSSVDHYARLGFLPLNVSDGDWVDEQEFRPLDGVRKCYDFVMIANFIPLKRHAFVFDAIRRHWQGHLRFALVASSWVGGAVAGAEALLREHGLTDAAKMYFDVSQAEVNRILNASRCHVLASEREGANRACLEALFAGIPALLPKGHVGFPHFRYDWPFVRLYRDGADLVRQIVECRTASEPQAISSAARTVAGSRVATEVVTAAMKRECLARGETWKRDLADKVTRVHCCYRDPREFNAHRADYEYLASVTRDGFSYQPARAQQLLTR
jgi:hypothetical protein